jgi:hypothetical protein
MTYKFIKYDRDILINIFYLITAASREMTLQEAQKPHRIDIPEPGDIACTIYTMLKLLETDKNMPVDGTRIVAELLLEKFNAVEGPKLDAKRTRSLDGSNS